MLDPSNTRCAHLLAGAHPKMTLRANAYSIACGESVTLVI